MKTLSCIPSRPDREAAAHVVNPITDARIPRGPIGYREIVEAIEQLPLPERAALYFRDIEQLPLDAVALQLGCSVRAARLHIAQGRIKLRNQFQAR
ncbi:MAG: sigma-70 region 4 domain-containing protein [Bryobacteraceae bacterium]|jgi:DNA-directed RNA polymerase specialized sigma24 family protein